MTTETDKAREIINAAPRLEQVHAAGCALQGIARGLNVPDETRAAIIAIAEWLQRTGWSSCQPEKTGSAAKDIIEHANKIMAHMGYSVHDINSGNCTEEDAFDVAGILASALVAHDNEDREFTQPERRTVPDDIIEKIVDLRLGAWYSDEIRSACREFMLDKASREDGDAEAIEDAELYGYKLCRDINDNWVLIAKEN